MPSLYTIRWKLHYYCHCISVISEGNLTRKNTFPIVSPCKWHDPCMFEKPAASEILIASKLTTRLRNKPAWHANVRHTWLSANGRFGSCPGFCRDICPDVLARSQFALEKTCRNLVWTKCFPFLEKINWFMLRFIFCETFPTFFWGGVLGIPGLHLCVNLFVQGEVGRYQQRWKELKLKNDEVQLFQ